MAALPARAELLPGTSCDTAFLDVIKNRGWMQGKREMEVAQTYIMRPDSILQYSCFDKRANDTGVNSKLVREPLGKYLSNNFGNQAAGGQNFNEGSDPCKMMGLVWDYLKCANFGDGSFFTLASLTVGDMRTLPQSCSAKEPDHNQKWQAAFAISSASPAAVMQTMASYMPPALDIFNPQNCKGSESCRDGDPTCKGTPPIPTGLMILMPDGQNLRPDRICAAPGCYYSFDPKQPNGAGECRLLPPE